MPPSPPQLYAHILNQDTVSRIALNGCWYCSYVQSLSVSAAGVAISARLLL